MKPRLALTLLLASTTLFAQSGPKYPPQALSAKTVAVLNDTHSSDVEAAAEDELKEWGHMRLTDDVQNADIVLHFSKKSEHAGQSTEKDDDSGTPKSWSYGMTFGSKISMDATLRDGVAPFYSTTTGESKRKAGRECIQAFIGKFQDSMRRP